MRTFLVGVRIGCTVSVAAGMRHGQRGAGATFEPGCGPVEVAGTVLMLHVMLIENGWCGVARAPNSILQTNERGLNVSWLVRFRVLATVVVEVHFIASEYRSDCAG